MHVKDGPRHVEYMVVEPFCYEVYDLFLVFNPQRNFLFHIFGCRAVLTIACKIFSPPFTVFHERYFPVKLRVFFMKYRCAEQTSVAD